MMRLPVMKLLRETRQRLARDIRAKLLLTFGVMAVFGMAGSFVAVGSLVNAYNELAQVTLRAQQVGESAVSLVRHAERMDGAVRSFLISGEDQELRPYYDSRLRFAQTLNDMEGIGIGSVAGAVSDIRRRYNAFVMSSETKIAEARAGFPRYARLRGVQGDEASGSMLVSRVEQMAQDHRGYLQQAAAEANRLKGVALLGAHGVALLTLTAGFALAGRFAANLVGPLRELAKAARAIEGGNFGVTVPERTRDEVGMLARAMNHMAATLQESQGHLETSLRESEVRNRELATRNAVAAAANSSLELDTMLYHVLFQTLQGADFEVGAISLLDEDTGVLHLEVVQGMAPDVVERFRSLHEADLLSHEAVIRREPVAVSDIITRLKGRYPELAGERFTAGLSVPVTAAGIIVGALTALSRRPGREIGDRDRRLLMVIGQQLGLAVHNARLYEKAQQLAVSEERNRLARELHDSVTQTLFSMTLMLQALPALVERNPVRARERAERVFELARGAQAEMRSLIFELRPATLQEEGLAAALSKHLAAFERREGVQTRLTADRDLRLPPALEQALFRIAQEALNNVSKHARATEAAVTLEAADGVVRLTVSDNGVGLAANGAAAPTGRTLGMRSMSERATALGGHVEVTNRPEGGAQVTAVVPIPPGALAPPPALVPQSLPAVTSPAETAS
ncbi:MAG: histidine kinase [Chloroflexi bacterium]|nr:histidine kinase [Chloroflexota bacterium]